MELARRHDADLSLGRPAHNLLEDSSKVVDRCLTCEVPFQRPIGRVRIGPVAFRVPKSSRLSWSTSASVDLLA